MNNHGKQTQKKLKYKKKTFNNSYQTAIYQFNNFEEFCSFSTYCNNTKLSDLKGIAKNIALYEYNNLYYLIFSNINSDYKNINLFYTSIAEFSKLASTSVLFKSKLGEHGNVIFKTNAIKNTIKYFLVKD